MKLLIRRNFGKFMSMWNLSNMFLDNGSKKKSQRQLENTDINENKTQHTKT